MKHIIIMACATALLAGCVSGNSGTGAASGANSEGARFMTGYEAAKNEEYAVAESKLTELLADDPNDPYANLALGYVMQQTGRPTEARSLYEIAVREGEDTYPDRHYVLEDQEYGSRPVEEDSIAELARRNIASL